VATWINNIPRRWTEAVLTKRELNLFFLPCLIIHPKLSTEDDIHMKKQILKKSNYWITQRVCHAQLKGSGRVT
jgi:hypothetical protein